MIPLIHKYAFKPCDSVRDIRYADHLEIKEWNDENLVTGTKHSLKWFEVL